MKYDYLIVGSGFFGSVLARELTDVSKKCLVIDKRDHIGGNAYSYKYNSIDVHKYGPHIFHTNEKKLWDYVNKYCNFIPYFNRGKVLFNNKIFSFPINLMTFNQLWGVVTPEEAKKVIEEKKIKINNPKNMKEYVLSEVGEEIYEIFIKGYTIKQWGRDPSELPTSIIKRIPIRYTYNEYSLDDIYQGVPELGYDTLFKNLLKNIDIQLNTDFFQNRSYFEKISKKIIFTGCIDQYFDYKFGSLEYRSLTFKEEIHEKCDYQGSALINFSNESIPYTRICEHKHFLPHLNKNNTTTILTKEFPSEWSLGKDPYYPINNNFNNEKYKLYLNESKKYNNVIFGGRLGEYKYYDMHQVIASALNTFKQLL